MILTSLAAASKMLIALVFLIAGVLKLRRHEPLPPELLAFFGLEATRFRLLILWLLSIVETGLGVLLLTHWFAVPALIGAGSLLTLFTILLFRAWRGGYKGECGCFGGLDGSPVGWKHIASNSIVLALTLFSAIQTSIANSSKAVWELSRSDVLVFGFLAGMFLALTHLMLHLQLIGQKLTQIRRERTFDA